MKPGRRAKEDAKQFFAPKKGGDAEAVHQIETQVKQDDVKYVNLQFTDLLGFVKSVTVPAWRLPEVLEKGQWFDGSSVEGFARIFESDMYLVPDPATYAVIPWQSEGGTVARLICDVYTPDGKPFAGCPRGILKRMMQEARDRGLVYNCGPELEFFLFRRNGEGLADVHDSGGYFDLNLDLGYDVRKEMTTMLDSLGIKVEASHHEVAHGQHEIDFKYGDALTTADRAQTFKLSLKAVAAKHGLHATFMPKPVYGINGSGMHVHQSLWDAKSGKNAFYDGGDKYHFSALAYSFLAGQIANVRGISAILSPLVNSYKRLVLGYEAPVYLAWGQINRSALIRIPKVPPGRESGTRCEIRCPDPSSNPYLVFAALLSAGLDGVERKLKPPPPVEEDLYEFDDAKLAKLGIGMLPGSLNEALDEMERSGVARRALGEHSFARYIEAKRREWDAYRVQVTEWEREQYLELY